MFFHMLSARSATNSELGEETGIFSNCCNSFFTSPALRSDIKQYFLGFSEFFLARFSARKYFVTLWCVFYHFSAEKPQGEQRRHRAQEKELKKNSLASKKSVSYVCVGIYFLVLEGSRRNFTRNVSCITSFCRHLAVEVENSVNFNNFHVKHTKRDFQNF
jgi:hypothetical protein